MTNRTSVNSKAIAHWLGNVLGSILLAIFVINSTSRLAGSNAVYWPSFGAQITALTGALLVVAIVQHAENKSDVQNPDLAISLFTFTNSVSALGPLVEEIPSIVLSFFVEIDFSNKLEASLIYTMLSQTSYAKSGTQILTLLVAAVATWICVNSANNIANRQRVLFYSTLASVLVLALKNILFSEWSASTYKLETDNLIGFVIWLSVLASLLSLTLSLSIFGISDTAKVCVSFVRSELEFDRKLLQQFLSSFLTRIIQIVLALSVFLYAPWELLIPNSVGFIQLLAENKITSVFKQSLIFTGQSLCWILLLVLALKTARWIATTFLKYTPELPLISFPQHYGRKVLRVLRWPIIVVISIIVLFSLARLFMWLFSLAVIFAVSLIPTKPEIRTSDPEIMDWSGTVASCEPLAANGFTKNEISFQCNSKYFGMGWEYGSSSDVTSSLLSCSISNEKEMQGRGFYLVVASSSVEDDKFLDRENQRALDRGFALATMLESQLDKANIANDIYVLNLGMETQQQFSVLNRSRYNRPIKAIEFNPFPEGSDYNDETIRAELSKFYEEEYGEGGHSLCEVYRFAENRKEGALTWTDLCP